MNRPPLQPVDPFGPGVDSSSRLGVVLANRNRMPTLQWFTQLGDCWSSCDELWKHQTLLRAILSTAAPERLEAMMTPEERAARAALADRLEVWRGCYPLNRIGLSWSLSEEAAIRHIPESSWPPDFPVVRQGIVRRERLVLKTDGQELVVISPFVRQITERQLLGRRRTGGVAAGARQRARE